MQAALESLILDIKENITKQNLNREKINMIRWAALVIVAFLAGKFIQDIVTNHGVDIWIARGAGILTVALITLVGYVLFLKPVSETR